MLAHLQAAWTQARPPSAVPGRQTLAFVDVSVIPMDRERVLAHQTVVVQDGRIVALGSVGKVRPPTGATLIDSRGKFLIPGLTDMHVHLGYPEVTPGDAGMEQTLFFYLANGITSVRDMHSTAIGGESSASRAPVLRRKVAAGESFGPRIYLTGDPASRSPAEAVESMEALKAAGYEFIKMGVDSGPTFDAIVAAAHRLGLRLVGHTPGPWSTYALAAALQVPYTSIEHLYGYAERLLKLPDNWSQPGLFNVDPDSLDTLPWMQPGYHVDSARLAQLVAATRRAGTWNCPTLFGLDVATATSDTNAQHPPSGDVWGRETWKRSARLFAQVQAVDFQVVKALYDSGAGLLAGTDAYGIWAGRVPPGFQIHRELELLVQAGLSPYAALAAATRNVAEFFETLDSAGTVAVGKHADLVLLAANPLQDIGATRGIAGVVADGRWLSRAAIDERLDKLQIWRGADRVENVAEVRRKIWRPSQ